MQRVGVVATAVFENGDLIAGVLRHLDARDLTRLASCSSTLRTHALDNEAWRQQVASDFPAAAGVEGAFYRYIYKAFDKRSTTFTHYGSPRRRWGKLNDDDAGASPALSVDDLQVIAELRAGDKMPWRSDEGPRLQEAGVPYFGWERCGRELTARTLRDVVIEDRAEDYGVAFKLDLGEIDTDQPEQLLAELAKEPSFSPCWSLSLSVFHAPTQRVGFLCDGAPPLDDDNGLDEEDSEDENEDFESKLFGGYHCHNDTSIPFSEQTASMIRAEAHANYTPFLHHLFWAPRVELRLKDGKLHGMIRVFVHYEMGDTPTGLPEGSFGVTIRHGIITDQELLMRILTEGADWS